MSGHADRRRALLDLTARPMLSPAEVAGLFRGQSAEWFYRERRALEAEGFPGPCWGNRAGTCYDPLAIGLWQVARLAPPQLHALDALLHGADAGRDNKTVSTVVPDIHDITDLGDELARRADNVARQAGRR